MVTNRPGEAAGSQRPSTSGISPSRQIRLQTIVIPQVRAIGFLAVIIFCGLHHALVSAYISDSAFLGFIGIVAAYNLSSWMLLRARYGRSGPVDLARLFLFTDLLLWTVAIYITGAEKSWMLFILILRAADQAAHGFRAVLRFAHASTASYVALLLWVHFGEHRSLNWSVEAVKVAGLYFGNLYVSLTALIHERTRRQMRNAREQIEQLQRKSLESEQERLRLAEAAEARAANWGARMAASLERIETSAARMAAAPHEHGQREGAVAEIRQSVQEALLALDRVLSVGPSQNRSRPFNPLLLIRQRRAAAAGRLERAGVSLVLAAGPNLPTEVSGDPGLCGWVLTSLLETVLQSGSSPELTLRVDAAAAAENGLTLEFLLAGAGPDAPASPQAARLVRQAGGKFRTDSDSGRGVSYGWTLACSPAPPASAQSGGPDGIAARGELDSAHAELFET